MLRGFLKTRSIDINYVEKIIDPLNLSFIFYFIFSYKIFFDPNTIIFFFVSFIILNLNNIYESYRIKNLNDLLPNIFSISALISLFTIFLQLNKSNLNRYVIVIFFSLSFLYLFFHHYILRLFLRYLRSKGFNSRNAVFFGDKESFILVNNQLRKYPWIGYRIVSWFSPNGDDYKLKEPNSFDLICDGDINELIKRINADNNGKIDNLFFCHNPNDQISFKNVLKRLGDLCLPITYLINWDINSISLKKQYFGDIVGLNIWNPGYSIINQQIKRFFDLSLALIIIFTLSPLLIVISILIKISSKGPIIFSQERYGLNGLSFRMFKFRTMYISKKKEDKQIFQAKKNDERVTKLGKFLRKYSLDELPQLINVIRGEMSLVGPRPHATQHNEYYRKLITGYMQRHSKLPGMTGLAQISGARGETSNIEMMKKRIEFDIYYNNNWSLMRDFSILIKTFFSVLSGKSY